MTRKPLIGVLARYASRLRFPQLFALTAALFLLDVLVPDFIPFADEILLALATILLGSWQKQRAEGSAPQDSASVSPEH
jgi:hypothetical protein